MQNYEQKPIGEVTLVNFPILTAELLAGMQTPELYEIVRTTSATKNGSTSLFSIVAVVRSGPRFPQAKRTFGLSLDELDQNYPELTALESTELDLKCFWQLNEQTLRLTQPTQSPRLHSQVWHCSKDLLLSLGKDPSGWQLLSKLICTFGPDPALVLSFAQQLFDWPTGKQNRDSLLLFLKSIFHGSNRNLSAIEQICKRL